MRAAPAAVLRLCLLCFSFLLFAWGPPGCRFEFQGAVFPLCSPPLLAWPPSGDKNVRHTSNTVHGRVCVRRTVVAARLERSTLWV
ncbi:MAG: hypothetical protein J3K34DRAFT_431864 [Monoraphidium minutum]|nr:MAG: hypothetical protein J3K34DRAFT_431864 [Monoraphidium minutum]